MQATLKQIIISLDTYLRITDSVLEVFAFTELRPGWTGTHEQTMLNYLLSNAKRRGSFLCIGFNLEVNHILTMWIQKITIRISWNYLLIIPFKKKKKKKKNEKLMTRFFLDNWSSSRCHCLIKLTFTLISY